MCVHSSCFTSRKSPLFTSICTVEVSLAATGKGDASIDLESDVRAASTTC